MPSGIENARKLGTRSREVIEAYEKEETAQPSEGPKEEESDFARMNREAAESAKAQEEALYRKNTGVGGVNAGKL
jgi:hypothetical protein